MKGFGSLLFIFGSSLGAGILLLHQLIAAPILYDFYNYDADRDKKLGRALDAATNSPDSFLQIAKLLPTILNCGIDIHFKLPQGRRLPVTCKVVPVVCDDSLTSQHKLLSFQNTIKNGPRVLDDLEAAEWLQRPVTKTFQRYKRNFPASILEQEICHS
ncbi:unnamed protein product [Fraxinus pennsylvanica]|uniref:Uncharacterized protein n=1 Tax=Fraxinus pennsylvanica TaxID=56036 RepID=A0AAD1ZS49_9LAMI|nr:unnamed protein product [Fraxinus pennsylvanica]